MKSKKIGLVMALCSAVIGSAMLSLTAVAEDSIGIAVFNKKGELILPDNYREWVFLGAPLTPHGLNNGQAGFPEYHHSYVNPDAYNVYKRTGEFPDGTIIAKELALLHKGDFEDGSKNAPSGRGFFAHKFNGMDIMVKDSKRYKDTNGWGFFNFGHHAPPYAASAPALPKDACAGCHIANAGKDMVFDQYYPILQE